MVQIGLNDGRSIPVLGLGTWKATEENEAYDAVKHAIEVGYRHIDCAWVYNNEVEVGRAIADVIAEGKVTRDELWVTSKLWNNRHEPDMVEQACRETLSALGLDYLDLYLVHWPMAFDRDVPFPRNGEGYLTLDEVPMTQTWEAMESLQGKGLVKSIGVSNCSTKHLAQILSSAKIKPAMNQVELHPYLVQEKLLAYCRENEIALTAYSPLGSGGVASSSDPGGRVSPLSDPIVQEIAGKHHSSPGSVLIAWAVNRGTVVIPKSSNKGRIAANLNASTLILDDEDMVQLEKLDRGLRIINPTIWLEGGSPYSAETLWADD